MKTPILNINQFKDTTPVNEVYINSFSKHIQLNKQLINTPHTHNFYLCVLFTEGNGIHEIDFNSYSIGPGKVFFLKPGQTHFWKFETQPEGFIFFHSQEFYDLKFLGHTLQSFPFYYSYQNPPVLDIPEEELFKLQLKFQEAYEEYTQTHLLRELRMVNLFNAIYIDLTRLYTGDIHIKKLNSPHYYQIVENLEGLINEHFNKERSVTFYADELHITTKHLNRVVQKVLYKTTSELIAERVILEAKRLIVHTHDNLATIADTLEFSEYAYFSKFFKSKTGTTPFDFRKKYRL